MEPLHTPTPPPRRLNTRRVIKGLVIGVVVIGALIAIKDEVAWRLDPGGYAEDYYSDDYAYSYIPDYSGCNVAKVPLYGDLMTYPGLYAVDEFSSVTQTMAGDVVASLEAAADSDDVKAIILEVDSGGGDPVSSKEIADALKRIEKPTIAVIRSQGASAAYMSATGADRIYASAFSDVGSIGVTSSYLDNSLYNKENGYVFNDLSSAKFKDVGNPDRALTEEDKTRILKDINRLHELLVDMVAENRNLPRENIAALADGSTMLGIDALESGLIDGVGDLRTVKDLLASELGEKVTFCE